VKIKEEVMITLAKDVKKDRKRAAVKNDAALPDNNFYTYIQMVEKVAYDLYEKRGRENGRDMEDWFEAQKLVEDEWYKNK
jgi:hypothetical protein